MSTKIIQCYGGVTLLGGGAVDPTDVGLCTTFAPDLVAADGGGDRALALGRMPLAVIGDLDSLSQNGRRILADRLRVIPEQDSTDFGKCLRHVRAAFYLCLGFTGMRLDHTLAALSEVALRPDQKILLIAEDEVIFLAPPQLALDLPLGTRLSLYPMGEASGCSQGLRWPIEGLAFAPAGRVGTSNEVSGPVRLKMTGPMLVMVPKAHLAAVLCALLPPSARGE